MKSGTSLSLDKLIALGAERLAAIMLDEAEGNVSFRKRLKAALAGTKGPDAVAKLVDRRIAALERARAVIAWEKEPAFADDLGALLDMIVKELAPLGPDHAVGCLIRFIDTHGSVFSRIDDSSGRIQGVYWYACEAVPELVAKLSDAERNRLPDRLSISLEKDTHGLARNLAVAVVPLLPDPVLRRWDEALRQVEVGDIGALEIRQAIADAHGDIDEYLALELRRPDWQQDMKKVAGRLLAADRLDEALLWVRREREGRDLERVKLEARILEAMKDRPAAQALRWAAFEATLDAGVLWDYIHKLDDFIEHEEQDRAFAIAMASPDLYAALGLFLAWPRMDLAAKLILEKRDVWDGHRYDLLGNAASALEDAFPVAATILYRVLLNDILRRAQSRAYGHAGRYFEKLSELSDRAVDDSHQISHAEYVAQLKQSHGRKVGFWAVVEGKHRR